MNLKWILKIINYNGYLAFVVLLVITVSDRGQAGQVEGGDTAEDD